MKHRFGEYVCMGMCAFVFLCVRMVCVCVCVCVCACVCVCESVCGSVKSENYPYSQPTCSDTLLSTSRNKRSAIKFDVSCEPSCPASGDPFTPTVMAIVGGSMGVAGMLVVAPAPQIVSLTVPLGRPAIEMMSPADALSTTTCGVCRVVCGVVKGVVLDLGCRVRKTCGVFFLFFFFWKQPVNQLSHASIIIAPCTPPSNHNPPTQT